MTPTIILPDEEETQEQQRNNYITLRRAWERHQRGELSPMERVSVSITMYAWVFARIADRCSRFDSFTYLGVPNVRGEAGEMLAAHFNMLDREREQLAQASRKPPVGYWRRLVRALFGLDP